MKTLLSILLLAAAAYGQTVVPLTAPALPVASGGLAATVGGAGSATYYYWVIAIYPGGKAAPSGPITARNAPASLSGGNFVRVTWDASSGATAYDVLRTTTTATPSTTCSCLLSAAVAGTSLSDTGPALTAYTFATAAASAAEIYLDNVLSAPPVLKQNIDGIVSTIGSGGGGSVTAGTGILVSGSEVSINPAVTQTLANDQSKAAVYCRSTTGNDTYTCALNPALTAYTRGMYVILDADTANTGAATLAISGLSALTILTRAGATPANGDIVANRGTLLYYNGTDLSIVGDGGGGAAGGSSGNLQFNNAGALGGIVNSSSPNAGEILLGTAPAASATRSAFGQGIALSGGSLAGTYHGINHSGGGFTGNWFNYQQGGANQFRAMAVAANASPGMIINGNNYPVGGYMLCSAAGNCSAISSDHIEGLKISHNSDSTFLTGVAIGFPREGGMQHLANPGAKPVCAVGTRGLQWFTFSGAGVKDAFEVCAKDAANAYAWRVIY